MPSRRTQPDHVLDAVKRSGANIGHLTSRPPTLNDVFLELTGKALRD